MTLLSLVKTEWLDRLLYVCKQKVLCSTEIGRKIVSVITMLLLCLDHNY